MAHVITYDGVESVDGGTIFADKRFWVAQRVPMRSMFVDMIKNNGGIMVPLEKNADYLIADHMRRDAPPGSYSFKFIEDSVKNGILQIEDRYRIGRDPDAPRPTGSSALAKRTRAPFTTEDDAALARWVLSHSGQRSGNAIYQDFELKNARHTWQSWRNRWKKKLCNLSMNELQRMANSAPAEQEDEDTSNRQGANTQPANGTWVERSGRGPSPPQVHQPETPEPRESDWQHDHSEQPALDQENDHGEQTTSELNKEQFYADLSEFAQQRDLSIERQPTIGGVTIELWDLVQAVTSQEISPEDVNWSLVASELGYARGSRELASRLQQCWEDNLLAFLEAVAEYEEEMEKSGFEGEDDEEQEGNDTVHHFREAERASELPSNPPSSRASRKRSVDDEEILESRPKRRRLDRNAEIASTPDEALRVSRRIFQDESPTARKQIPASLVEVKDSQDDTQATLRSPRTPQGLVVGDNSRSVQLEIQESFADVTPSQQLRYESRLSASPANWDIHRERRGQATSSYKRSPEQRHRGSKSSPDLGSRSRQRHPTHDTSPSAPPRQTRPVRRSLPSSFATATIPPPHSEPPSSRRPHAAQPFPDTHDPFNQPGPRPRRDTPNFDTIEGWIEHYESMGYPHHIVDTALKSTTLTPGGVAAHVMESLRSGHGVPKYNEGVWTGRDDRSLRIIMEAETNGNLEREALSEGELHLLRNARKATIRLTNKHGAERMAVRKRYLKAEDREEQA